VVAAGTRNENLSGTAEQDITNAILKVSRDSVKTVCFVEGHGERATDSNEPEGYANVTGAIKNEGYQTKSINLVSAGQVPPECSVIIDAGPKQSLFPQESQIIAKYLDGGGKALILLDPEVDPKINDLLQAWNITLGTNVVIDASGVGRMFGTGPAVPLVVSYGANPITRNFAGTMTFFPLARTVSITEKNKPQPDGTELLMTSDRSFTVPNLKQKEISYDPAKDNAGPLSLGVAAEKKVGAGAPQLGVNTATGNAPPASPPRLVVIGNSSFAANQWSGMQRNGDLFMNTVNWLAQDEDLISIRPKSPTNRRVVLTETQQRELSWLSLILLPGIVIISGAMIWFKRR
jgi:ABC-type uncharacterized transport system involved in gliding motility auxiliary subunit